MDMRVWATRTRTFSIGCLLLTSIFLLSPVPVNAFSWADVPLIGGWFARPDALDLRVSLTTKLPNDTKWQKTIQNVGTGKEVQFKITVENSRNAIFTDVRLITIAEENLTFEQDIWEIARLGRNATHEIEFLAYTNATNIEILENKCNLIVVNVIYLNESVSSDTATVCVTHDLDSFGKILGSNMVGSTSPTTGIFDFTNTITVPLLTLLLGLIAYSVSIVMEKRFL